MSREKVLRRPTAFVTGASQGIGAGSAMALAHDGYDVAVASTELGRLSAILAELKAVGANAIPVKLDLRSQVSIVDAMAQVVSEFGELDVLVNNAGAVVNHAALEVTAADWKDVIDINLTGTFFMSQLMGRHLIGSGRVGCIINIASTHGIVAVSNRVSYGVAKAGVIHMTKMLAIEWAEKRIRVNAVAPGSVPTPARAALQSPINNPSRAAERLARIPMRRTGTIEEIASAVSYLASPGAAYITGQTLIVDGGVTSQ